MRATTGVLYLKRHRVVCACGRVEMERGGGILTATIAVMQ